jgi:hypothetical protein
MTMRKTRKQTERCLLSRRSLCPACATDVPSLTSSDLPPQCAGSLQALTARRDTERMQGEQAKPVHTGAPIPPLPPPWLLPCGSERSAASQSFLPALVQSRALPAVGPRPTCPPSLRAQHVRHTGEHQLDSALTPRVAGCGHCGHALTVRTHSTVVRPFAGCKISYPTQQQWTSRAMQHGSRHLPPLLRLRPRHACVPPPLHVCAPRPNLSRSRVALHPQRLRQRQLPMRS